MSHIKKNCECYAIVKVDLCVKRYWKLLNESAARDVFSNRSVPRSFVAIRSEDKAQVTTRRSALKVLPLIFRLHKLLRQRIRSNIP